MRDILCVFTLILDLHAASLHAADELVPVRYNNPGLTVDLGVGLWAWPMPMDFDEDGDLDLVVSCPDKPYNGTYFFENPDGNVPMPTFKPGVRLGKGYHNIRVSHVDGKPRVLVPGREFTDFRTRKLDAPHKLPLPANIHGSKVRANQWGYADLNDDGRLDLLIAVGDWQEYGWDDAFNEKGEWTRGPLRGFVYLAVNEGSNATPKYAKPRKLQVGADALEVFGWPSPCPADFDNDGDLDLICGEFLDKLTYFENQGTAKQPRFATGRRLRHDGRPIQMDLQMIVPAPIDWDKDGDVDLVVGDEDGRVALIENTGTFNDRVPQFLPPRYFQQQADRLKCGALATPFSYDWDGDGDEDILCGNTAGYVGLFENLGSPKKGELPRWAKLRYLKADGKTIRIQAGPNGSIQGPCEAKWGYTTLSVADWDHDGLPDLVVNSIWGEVLWYRNSGTRTKPKLNAASKIDVQWPGAPPKPEWTWWNAKGKQLVTQWRTTPEAVDFNRDGLTDLVMLDHEGYLTLFKRQRVSGELQLLPPERIFVDKAGKPLRLNTRRAGGSGRRKIHVVDFDGDGALDVLVNSQNADLLKGSAVRNGKVLLEDTGTISPTRLAGHTSSPATVNWSGGRVRDLLIGAEDGHLYYMPNSSR